MSLHILLDSPLPAFANEFCDVVKLFFSVEEFSVGDVAETNVQEVLVHRFFEENAQWHCTFTFRGETCAGSMAVPVVEEERRALFYKRFQKRLCKLTLYDLFKKITGMHPPFGSLTGVRPTRLLYENIAAGMSLQQAATALTDDFDVMPDKAELLRRIVEKQMTLPLPSSAEVDIYLSIPFCRTRCAYCSFPGETAGKEGAAEAYLSALFYEMEQTADLLAEQQLKLRAIYVGGGTPTALSEGEFARLIKRTHILFPNAYEWTVEAGRPDTITRGKLQALLDFGVNRISINPQTMNDKTLALIGRGHTAEEAEKAFALARQMGFSNINMDVIAGLPGETPGDFAYTMEKISRLAPESLTVHTLAIKRSSRLDLEKAPLPEGKAATQMVAMGEKAARKMGMEPYYLYRQKYMAGQQQNVGYAKTGAACLYNIDIMEENTSILACGAGAISKRVLPARELRIVRAPNVSNVEIYCSRVTEMMERKRAVFA